MTMSSSEDSDSSYFKEKSRSYYDKIEKGEIKVISDGTYRCPLCTGTKKQVYTLDDLLQHTAGVAKSTSEKWNLKLKAQHDGVHKFLAEEIKKSERQSRVLKVPIEPKSEKFVWPVRGVIANVLDHAAGNSKIADQLSARMLDFDKVKRIFTFGCKPTEYALVQFPNNWTGFLNALRFEKSFELDKHGRMDYFSSKEKDNELYGWVAMSDDYNKDTVYGRNLCETGDLKTVGEVEEERDALQNKLIQNILAQREQVEDSTNKKRKCI